MASSPLKVGTNEQDVGMSARIRAFDWSQTPLGSMEDWLRAELHFEPDGLRCVIEASREVVQGREVNLA